MMFYRANKNKLISSETKQHVSNKYSLDINNRSLNMSSVGSSVMETRHHPKLNPSEIYKRSSSSIKKKVNDNDKVTKTLTFSEPPSEVFFKPHREQLLRFVSDEQKKDTNLESLKRYEDQIYLEKKKNSEFDLNLKSQVEQHKSDLIQEKNK